MPGDAFYLPQPLEIHETERQSVEWMDSTIIVYGYVDYIDQFGAHHRAGYGRQYIAGGKGNNLAFPVVRAKLNYDEVRTVGIGWDWPNQQHEHG